MAYSSPKKLGLGISVYPEHCSQEETLAYIDAAGKRGYTRVFSCLLSVKGDRGQIVEEFKPVAERIHANGMQLVLDVWPAVLDRLGVSPEDLSFFHDLGADGLRLDAPYADRTIAEMTHNPFGLVVEVNASMRDAILESALLSGADSAHLWACHNFYPQRYSGLSYEFWEETSIQAMDQNIRVASFVGCENHDAMGPWGNGTGLPTLEMHRDLAPGLAARHLAATGLVDDILISNAFATEEELDDLAAIDPLRIDMKIDLEDADTDVEREIIFNFPHVVRGDLSPYILRSSMARVKYHDTPIPPHDTRDAVRGDIVVVNDNDPRYKGELQVVLRDMKNLGLHNIVGHVPEEEQILIDYLDSWQRFGFIG